MRRAHEGYDTALDKADDAKIWSSEADAAFLVSPLQGSGFGSEMALGLTG